LLGTDCRCDEAPVLLLGILDLVKIRIVKLGGHFVGAGYNGASEVSVTAAGGGVVLPSTGANRSIRIGWPDSARRYSVCMRRADPFSKTTGVSREPKRVNAEELGTLATNQQGRVQPPG